MAALATTVFVSLLSVVNAQAAAPAAPASTASHTSAPAGAAAAAPNPAITVSIDPSLPQSASQTGPQGFVIP